MEIILVPPASASGPIHLGNIYNFIIIDTYRRALESKGYSVLARETWNCYSRRLENDVKNDHPNLSTCEIKEESKRRVEEGLVQRKELMDRYGINFASPPIRDDSQEYQEFFSRQVDSWIRTNALSGNRLRIDSIDEVIEKAKKIEWIPLARWTDFYGLADPPKSVPFLREGVYGFEFRGIPKGNVVNQRVVQMMLPGFYLNSGQQPNVGIFGKDVLVKWIYFMISQFEQPANKIALSGLVLNKGRKMSKYSGDLESLDKLNIFHPDEVRMGLVKQRFGGDFNQPDFGTEERVRKKVINCLQFLNNYSSSDENSQNLIIAQALEYSNKIRENILDFNFENAYREFHNFFFDYLSRTAISSIRTGGISQESRFKLLNITSEVVSLFMPKTIGN